MNVCKQSFTFLLPIARRVSLESPENSDRMAAVRECPAILSYASRVACSWAWLRVHRTLVNTSASAPNLPIPPYN